MNSAEEISKYRQSNENNNSPTLNRRFFGHGYDFPEKSPKKEKKWSIGSLFRRKKKDEHNSGSSSEEDLQKNNKSFLSRKKRKSDKDKKRKGNKTIGTFDHVVIPRNLHLYSNGYVNQYQEDLGVLSDPSTGGFFSAQNKNSLRKLPDIPSTRKPIDVEDLNNSRGSIGSGSADSLTVKKVRKGLAKVRAEARRLSVKHGSSSDEDSQISASSARFRSDESIGAQRDGSFSRRSRAARTERYLKRHSRDGENPNNYLRLSKSDAENSNFNWKTSDDSNRSLSRSPLVPKVKTSFSSISSQSPSLLGLSTIPPSHGSHNKVRVSNSTSNPSYKPPLSMNEYNMSTKRLSPKDYLNNQRSVSCDANIHKEIQPEVIHVQFPLGKPSTSTNRFRNLSLVDPRHINAARQPPPPPPRDPRRLVTAQYFENSRPNTYYFDSTGQMRSKSFNANYVPPTKRMSSYNLNTNGRSTSEDHLSHNIINNVQVLPRPSSATPDAAQKSNVQDMGSKLQETYNYLTDKKPRSRKPIFIKNNTTSTTADSSDKTETQKALDFWKQKEMESKSRKSQSKSPQMFTCQTHVQTQVFLPSVVQNDINNSDLQNGDNRNTDSPFQPISTAVTNTNDIVDETDEIKRKSSNLEEALDELEAIYNSLRLGDEDLLERAEQREKDAAAKQFLNGRNEMYIGWGMSRGALSDSGFSYEPFDSVDSPRRKRLLKKSQTIDRKADDMAFRKLHKERSHTINDPQAVVSKLSYMQASPVYYDDFEISPSIKRSKKRSKKDPDITLDDVVYRNIKYSNNSPKVVEPQLPFGIPVGPITVGANSDYLHAVPENIHRPTFKPRKIPDLVKDDLAFRNLRKDSNKEPSLPSNEDLKNNNSTADPFSRLDLNSLKKKRAVRSLSANIGNLLNKNNNIERENEFKTLTDIADAMEIARQVLKEKEDKISATRRAFLSDTDTNNGNGDFTENRLNFLNSLKYESNNLNKSSSKADNGKYLHAKPPRGLTPERKSPRSPKESTPIPVSPLEEKLMDQNASAHSSLDELLTALATEARETSERITNELKQYKKDDKNTDEKRDLNKKLSEIDAVSEQAKLCEKLLEGVVDSNDLMTSALKPDLEEVREIKSEPALKESVANVVQSTNEKIEEKACCESDHDYENLASDSDLTLEVKQASDDENRKKCVSPFEEHKAELIASFQELKKNVDQTDLNKKKDISTDNKEAVTGEECVDVSDCSASETKECACVVLESSLTSNTCDLSFTNIKKINSSSHCSDTESSSSGFHSNSSEGVTTLNSLESLKSPKLVLETSKLSNSDTASSSRQILKNQSMICRDSSPGTSSGHALSNVRARDGNRCEPRHILDDDEKPSAWYRDPATVAVACSYGIACAHQLASLDFVAILGILFAVLSFIAALIF